MLLTSVLRTLGIYFISLDITLPNVNMVQDLFDWVDSFRLSRSRKKPKRSPQTLQMVGCIFLWCCFSEGFKSDTQRSDSIFYSIVNHLYNWFVYSRTLLSWLTKLHVFKIQPIQFICNTQVLIRCIISFISFNITFVIIKPYTKHESLLYHIITLYHRCCVHKNLIIDSSSIQLHLWFGTHTNLSSSRCK